MYPPDVPVMLAGVSMGGLVATLAVLDAGIAPDGLILVAPLLDVDMSAAMKAQAAIGGLLARAVPNARITPGVEPRRLSKDADAVREYVDQLVGGRLDRRAQVSRGEVAAPERVEVDHGVAELAAAAADRVLAEASRQPWEQHRQARAVGAQLVE